MRRIVFLISFLALGCNGEIGVQPIPISLPVSLTLEAIPNAGGTNSPILLVTTFTNTSTDTLIRLGGCGYLPKGGSVEFLDPGGRRVYFQDPRLPRCLAVWAISFPPGVSVSDSVRFDGIAYDSLGNLIVAPSGLYTAVASYGYRNGIRDRDSAITGKTFFQWGAQVSSGSAPNIVLRASATAAQGSPGVPVSVTATLSNVGNTTVNSWAGCDYLIGGMTYQIRDTSGRVLYLYNPIPRKMCPDYEYQFTPGRSFADTLTFNGTLYDAQGNMIIADNESYTMSVSFAYTYGGLDQSIVITKSVSIQWNAQ